MITVSRDLNIIVFSFCTLASSPVLAQAPVFPGAGGQFQQIPPPATPQRRDPEIRVDPPKPAAIPDSDRTRIRVDTLRVSGQTIYTEAELIALTGFRPGGELSLGDLRAMAARIAEHYKLNGYFVAQAYLPAQDIKNGVVTIAVLEGRYGRIVVRNEGILSGAQVNRLLEGLNRGDLIQIAPLEHRLLLLSDTAGVNVQSTLVPGAAVGESDLIVELTPGQRVTGSVEADNGGSRYTGAGRVGGTVNINNLTGHGDVLSFRGLTSGDGLKYGRAAYQAPIGKATVGIAYSALEYRLGKEFSALQAHGDAQIASIYGSYPLIRSRNTNLYALAGFDYKTFEDRIDSTVPPTVTEKRARVGWLGLNGSHRDGLGGGGLSRFSLTASAGDLDIRTPAAAAIDAVTAQSNGHFGKFTFHGSRQQRVTDIFSLYGAINGQFASKNLDISEKMALGGPYGVRAYPVGEAYADEGYIVNLEARLLVSRFSQSLPGQVHLVGFVDTGTVTLNKNPWAPGDNHRTLSGAGVGLTWADYNNFAVSAYWAHKLGNERATSAPDRSSRIWLHGVKFF
jgi:hemolysin activation/secretion protein